MEDRALRYFLAVIRAGSIRGAAEALHVASSAISRQIAEMEAQHGLPLLERHARGVVPTEAGAAVAEHARRREEEALLLQDRLARLRRGEGGTVRLWAGEGLLADLLEHGLSPFGAAHPGIGFSVTLGGTARIQEAVAEGEADLGLAYNPPAQPGLTSLARAPQPLMAILPPGHRLARETGAVALHDLAGEPMGLMPPGHGIRHLLARVEADGGFLLAPRLETASIELLRRFVTSGMGITFLPRFSVGAELRQGALVALPLADPLPAAAMAHLLARAGRELPASSQRLAGWLGAHLLAFAPARG
ncbi:LysR family transcriptional regulator [Acetobacteraceae bacterium H6797]|nr:LysR family transcriptional regulator [Acetobacteraceae bacterium H6797]